MNYTKLSKQIEDMAISCGYDSCGIIPIDNMDIHFAGGMQYEHSSIGSLRYAAEAAGLGIVRKNNFLYTEKGSYLELVGYVIDQPCELYHEHNLRPCAENCNICRKACPTGALCAPFTMSPMKCVSFTNTFGKGILLPGIKEEQQRQWVVGCEECQDSCPYNRGHDWSKGEEIPALTSIAEKLLPENIVNADDEFIKNELVTRTFDHLSESQIGTIRRCAKRSLRNKAKTMGE